MITHNVDAVKVVKRNPDDLSQLVAKISGLADAQNHKMCYTYVEGGRVFVKVSLNMMQRVGSSTLAGIVNYKKQEALSVIQGYFIFQSSQVRRTWSGWTDGMNWPLGVANSACWMMQVRRTLTLK